MKRFNKFIAIALVGCILTACSDRKDSDVNMAPEVVLKPRNVDELNYEVRLGDTVGSVANKHNMTRAELIRLNQLTPPYELYEGQKLIVKNSINEIKNDAQPIVNAVPTSNTVTSPTTNAKIELVQEGGMKTEYETKQGPQVVEEFSLVDEETKDSSIDDISKIDNI